jgi:putative ABC transport system substrate-binding protein
MKRRQFISLLGGALAAWPRVARAQQPVTLGFLNSGALGGYRNLVIALRKGLAEMGFVDGQNLTIEYRWADGQFDRLPALATELIARGATVIVTGGIGSALGVRKASATIPLVFLAGDDPVKFGLVTSLNRPGGNTTGIAWLTSEIFSKRLEMIRELVSDLGLVGILVNPRSPEAAAQIQELEAAGQTLRQQLALVPVSDDAGFDRAFTTLAEKKARALLVSNDAFFNGHRDRIIALAARHHIPAIYDRREYTVAGGLISYGTSYTAAYRELGIYAGKILKGANPADLPVEQATKFELVINLTTAKALGVAVPDKLLALADEVIE